MSHDKEIPVQDVADKSAQTSAAENDPAALIAELQREVQLLKEKELRMIAEGRNLSQRLQREKEESLRFAEADFARELLVVIDDLNRTQESASKGADAGALADGVRIVNEHFMKLLRSRKVEPIAALGEPFDPQFHEALLQQPSDTVPAGSVVAEVARGYKMHDRVLRPARVVVSTGPAKA